MECLGTDTLVEYLEGRASAADRAAVERHASRCDECRRVLSSLARDPAVVTPGDAPTVVQGAIDAPIDELAPGARVARYVVQKRLGAGGMGVVYAAYDPELDRAVAIKLLAPGLGSSGARELFEERLRREARALAQLAHPNVVAIYDVGKVGERLFIAMELLDGVTLADWLLERRERRDILDKLVAAGRGLAAAHAAGIVHRDVKPQNIMLGKDGRVRVVDFGLARATGESSEGSDLTPDARRLTPGLTATGAVMGTPHYMAPEQHRGEEVDARTDQFAFCVAVYVALFDARPFDGDDLESLAKHVAAGELREPPRRAPRKIWRALKRGMAADRADRFATIDELLAQIAPDRRPRWVVPVAAAGVLAAAGGLALALRGHPGPVCEGMTDHLANVWDAPRKAAVTSALGASAPAVIARLDDYTARWVAKREDACTATRVRGDQTEEVMGLRMACLDDRLANVRALVDQLAHADRAVAARAISATYALADLSACDDVAALRRPGKPPRDPALVAALRGKLADARALETTGRYRDGLAAVKALAPELARAAYRPVEAEAALLEGTLDNDLDVPADAVAALERAVFAAEASGSDDAAANALIELVHIHGTHGKFADADAAAKRATAAIERIGGSPRLAADLDYAVGMVAMTRGDLAAARTTLARSIATAESLQGAADMRLAAALVALGQVELADMRPDQARPQLERALAIETKLYGAGHPELASVEVALGGAAYESADYDGAAAHYERAIALLDKAIGHVNIQTANALANLAEVRQWQGRAPDALTAIQEALAIDAKTLPENDPQTATHRVTEADVLEQLDRHADALAATDRALATMHTLYGADHKDIADALHSRALIGLAAGQLDRAFADARDALAMYGRVAPDFPLAELDRTLGRIELARHHAAEAADYFAQARARPRPDADAFSTHQLDAYYGRALVEAGRDRAKGVALVTAAFVALRADARSEEWRELETWMRAHGVAVPPR